MPGRDNDGESAHDVGPVKLWEAGHADEEPSAAGRDARGSERTFDARHPQEGGGRVRRLGQGRQTAEEGQAEGRAVPAEEVIIHHGCRTMTAEPGRAHDVT